MVCRSSWVGACSEKARLTPGKSSDSCSNNQIRRGGGVKFKVYWSVSLPDSCWHGGMSACNSGALSVVTCMGETHAQLRSWRTWFDQTGRGERESDLQDLGDDTHCADGDLLSLQAEAPVVCQHAHRSFHGCVVVQRLTLHPNLVSLAM